MPAMRLGMGIAVYAGGNDDAEGIWSAILDLNTRRLGHALYLADSAPLLRSVAGRRIGIEMCPYANLQIVGIDTTASCGDGTNRSVHPLKHYLDAGVPVIVNTDNIGIFGAFISDTFRHPDPPGKKVGTIRDLAVAVLGTLSPSSASE